MLNLVTSYTIVTENFMNRVLIIAKKKRKIEMQ